MLGPRKLANSCQQPEVQCAFKCFELILGKMYTIITNSLVKLTEKDVPGAELLYKKVEKNTICQLKRCLKCRKQFIKGKKQLVDGYIV